MTTRIIHKALLALLILAGCARPAARPAPTPSPAALAATRLDDTTYELGTLPSQLLLAGQAAFFTASDAPGQGGQHIYRLDLATSQVQAVVASRLYADGLLDSYRLGLAGDWLVYLEISAGDNGQSWTLAARNLASSETLTLDQASGDKVGWPGPEVAADGDWVVWIRKEAGEPPHSWIHARNLATGETKTLASALDASQETWGWPNLRDGLLVVERDRQGESSATSSVQLIDVRSGAVTPLNGDGQASEPSLDGRYVVWKAGQRYGQGPLAIYDTASGETRRVDLMVEYPRSGDGVVVAWAVGQGLVRVDAATGSHEVLAPIGERAGYQPAPEVSVDGRRVAWLEWPVGEQAQPRSRLRVQG